MTEKIKFLSEMDNNFKIQIDENETVSLGEFLKSLRKRGIMVWHEIEMENGMFRGLPRVWRKFKQHMPRRPDRKQGDKYGKPEPKKPEGKKE